jgi:hypothetical protein
VTLRARWVTLRARWVMLIARWVTLRARWVTLRALLGNVQVVELKRGTNSSVILNNLYKHTKLQTRVTVIMISLVNNQPKTLALTEMLQYFIDFRVQVSQTCVEKVANVR